MMPRLLLYLSSGLLLISCDRPEPVDAVLQERVAARTQALRETSRNQPATLRDRLEAARRIESPEAREKSLSDLAWDALELEPEIAVEAFQKLQTDSAAKILLVQHYAMRLAEDNLDSALAWAATVGSEQEIAAAHGQIALVLAETSPRYAAEIISEQGVIGRTFDVAVVQVVQRWAVQSPPEAAAWVARFPPGAARKASITALTGQWLHQDAAAAFGWLASLQDLEVRQEAALAMEGLLLQQPGAVRDSWRGQADAAILSELDQQRQPALSEMGGPLPQAAQ